MIGIHFICRECGTPCDPEAARDRGGLCARCAFPARVTVKSYQIAIDRERAVSTALESAAQAIEAVAVERDPIRDAIERATIAWAEETPDYTDDGNEFDADDNCTWSYP